MDLVNHPGTPKLWAIAYENNHKRKNNEFFVMPLKHVQSVMDLVNQPGTPKLLTKTAINAKMTIFLSCLSNMYRVSWAL
jgi:hypothetical protein